MTIQPAQPRPRPAADRRRTFRVPHPLSSPRLAASATASPFGDASKHAAPAPRPRRVDRDPRQIRLGDIVLEVPRAGRLRVSSPTLFAEPDGPLAREVLLRTFSVTGVQEITIECQHKAIEILFDATRSSKFVLSQLAKALVQTVDPKTSSLTLPDKLPRGAGSVRLTRFGTRLSLWSVRHELSGRIRLEHPRLFRSRLACQAVERELMNTAGVDLYATNDLTSSVLIHFDPRQISRDQLVELLEAALPEEEETGHDPIDFDLPLCTLSLGLAATSRFALPALGPLSTATFLYSTVPSFKNAYHVLFKERRLGVDVLDAIVVVICVGTGQVFAGTVLAWALGVARKLVRKSEDDSRKMLLNVFGKQPRFVWIEQDDAEVQTPIDRLKADDIIIIHTGETVPVDGEVVDGMAMIDQRALTGESAPAEKLAGDKVFASTIMIAGKIRVKVASAGEDTTSAKLAKILNDTAGYKLRSQTEGERLADKAVVPTLALGALGFTAVGVNGGTAIINCDLGTGIRVAAPIAMLSSLTLSAQHGILVKDGRALEAMRKVDTFLFDKTGTLTRERPEVSRILTFQEFSERQILKWAAAAENKFTHPIAHAIVDRFRTLGIPMPTTDDSKYKVGYGITVAVEDHLVCVGSARFMQHEGIALPEGIDGISREVHAEGHSLIFVGVDGQLGGALEMRAAERPEAEAVIKGLRSRGAKHIAIISGDHDRPTRSLAEKLGVDRYFAEVLPEDKANYVELLQKEGRTVCFVGDGINDSIALRKADVSISLRGASSVATDAAQVVFMDDSLGKILTLSDISRQLQGNINRSWALILVPNLLCMAGAFFSGFGVMHSMVFNQIGGLLALGNGLLPLREVVRLRAEKEAAQRRIAEAATIEA